MWEAGLPELVQQQGQGEVHVLAALLLALHCGAAAAARRKTKNTPASLHRTRMDVSVKVHLYSIVLFIYT